MQYQNVTFFQTKENHNQMLKFLCEKKNLAERVQRSRLQYNTNHWYLLLLPEYININYSLFLPTASSICFIALFWTMDQAIVWVVALSCHDARADSLRQQCFWLSPKHLWNNCIPTTLNRDGYCKKFCAAIYHGTWGLYHNTYHDISLHGSCP